MEILALIPARGGSKGIPHKNTVDLCGKPLLQYTIEAAKESKLVTRTIVSTDDESIANIAMKIGVEVMRRPIELSGDMTPMKDVIDYVISQLDQEEYKPDVLVLLQPTSPLRTAKHIDEALLSMLDDSNADAVVSVIELPHLHSPLKIMKTNSKGYLEFYLQGGEQYTLRQTLPKFYARNGAAIYAVKVESYKQTKSLYGTNCLPYVMSQNESIDIDDIGDIEIAKYYLETNGIKETMIY